MTVFKNRSKGSGSRTFCDVIPGGSVAHVSLACDELLGLRSDLENTCKIVRDDQVLGGVYYAL